jgi:hypothetical protein
MPVDTMRGTNEQTVSDPARITAVIASDSPLRIFRDRSVCGAAAAARSEDRQRRATLFQEFCDRFSKYGDKTLTLFADGQEVEVPVFF